MTFKKGDPRINRKGRPKDFLGLRALAQEIANEVAITKGPDGKPAPLVIDNHTATVAEAIMRKWATSTDVRQQAAFIEYAYGRVPQQQEVTGADGGPIIYKIVGDLPDGDTDD